MSRIFAAVVAAALFVNQATAQDAPPAAAPLTLDAALAAARQPSPALEAASASAPAAASAKPARSSRKA